MATEPGTDSSIAGWKSGSDARDMRNWRRARQSMGGELAVSVGEADLSPAIAPRRPSRQVLVDDFPREVALQARPVPYVRTVRTASGATAVLAKCVSSAVVSYRNGSGSRHACSCWEAVSPSAFRAD